MNMRKYKVTLGNIEERPGHRHDCAQIELAVHVRAPDAAGALAAVVVLAREHVRVEEVLS